jgi:hypothetical protein
MSLCCAGNVVMLRRNSLMILDGILLKQKHKFFVEDFEEHI